MLYIIFETCMLHFSELDFLTNIRSVFIWERNNYHFNCSKIKWLWSQFAFCMVATNKPKQDTLHCLLEKKWKNWFWNFQKLNCFTLHLFQPRQRKQKTSWKIAYTWKNQVYLSMITLVCELWVVWSLWICWESGFACALCGPLSVCCCQLVGLCLLASFHFLHVSV